MLLMTFATKPAAALARAAVRTGRGATYLVRIWRHRRDVLRLSELDERGLKDIGLVRSDIEGALAISWLRDPSSVLQARSSQHQDAAVHRREVGLRRPVVRPTAKDIKIACNA